MHDPVHSPAHYGSPHGVECIQAIKASMSQIEFEGFLKGSMEKYIWRWREKGGVEDLRKANWFLNYLIDENSN